MLHLQSGLPNPVALDAAVRIARAFGSGVEALFIEDEQLIDCAAYGFLRELSFSGRRRGAVSPAGIAHDLRLAAQGAHRQVELLASAADVPLQVRVMRDEPLRALAIACAESGPWNVVAFAEPFDDRAGGLLKQMLQEIAGTTGVVMAGPKARRAVGPIVVAVEDVQQLSGMLMVAQRLAALDSAEIVLLLIAPDEERLAWMEGEARLALEDREGVQIRCADLARGEAAAVAETLRRMHGGFVICQFGGLVVPEDGKLAALASVLECPLFLVR
ncbi:MAG TPA: hypothetical protein VG900_17725 [Hyphomicrobiaceae bacterium]|nr:hypothetical protein [Hyphomicrobiaceae bacterium]